MQLPLFFLLLFFVSCGKHFTKNEEKNTLVAGTPSTQKILQKEMSFQFNFLPLKGRVTYSNHFWSGHSWPNNLGSINYRWASSNPNGFFNRSPNYREVSQMPLEEIAELSPAEKFDLYLGNYDYPLKRAVENSSSPYMENWEGICHGWAVATTHHPAPKAKILKNPDGILIPFGVPDIKALLSFAYSKELIEDEENYGLRCEDPTDITEDRCLDDLPAHIFHAIITNKVGLLGQSIIMDIDPGREVWNHPVLSYQGEMQSFTRSKNIKKAIIHMEVKYLDTVPETSWNISSIIQGRLTLKYEIILNDHGTMVGSRWISRNRPDFIWTMKKRSSFSGDLNRIFDLLK